MEDNVLSMPLEEAMRTQRALRRLKQDPVDDALILHLVELAMKAPSGTNLQRQAFVVVRDKAVLKRLGDLNRKAWAVYGRLGRLLSRGDAMKNRMLDAVQHMTDHWEEMPALIVACSKGRAPIFPHLATASYYASVYPSVQNLLLAARAAGLGACLITLPLWNVRAIKRALGLPGNVTPCAFIPLGWPVGRYGPTTRRPVGEVVHVDRWGHQPFKTS